jgi:hypothetical protein
MGQDGSIIFVIQLPRIGSTRISRGTSGFEAAALEGKNRARPVREMIRFSGLIGTYGNSSRVGKESPIIIARRQETQVRQTIRV